MTRQAIIALLFFFALPAFGYAADDSATLKVRVEGIRSQKGELGIALFDNKKGYPTHIEHAYEPAWKILPEGAASTEHEFDGLPAGEYAVSVVHDTIANRKVDRSTFGFPKEGVGFSNDQKVTLEAPDFKDCKFPLKEGETKEIVITLEYRD